MKKVNLILMISCSVVLAGCGEHELCEKFKSATAKMVIGISDLKKPGITMYDLQQTQQKTLRATEEATEISREIDVRNIKCKKQ